MIGSVSVGVIQQCQRAQLPHFTLSVTVLIGHAFLLPINTYTHQRKHPYSPDPLSLTEDGARGWAYYI